MYYFADFETTTENTEFTEVWAAAITALDNDSEDFICDNLPEFINHVLENLHNNDIIYFHNLAFDGQFILAYLYNKKVSGFTQSLRESYNFATQSWSYQFERRKTHLPNKSFTYLISEQNQFYSITLHHKNKTIYIRDSLKLLPMSVKAIGESFKTKHQKTSIDYAAHKNACEPITQEEREYIFNDVYVVKEALKIMLDAGYNKITIGSNCVHDFRKDFEVKYGKLDVIFPDLTHIHFSREENADHYIRQSYKGGWCYLKSGCENLVYHDGITLDVNSLYPSRMISQSGCRYPYGKPTYWQGNYIPEELQINPELYFFIRIKTQFRLKPGKLPTIQIKANNLYKANEWLASSDIHYKGRYSDILIHSDGSIETYRPVLTLTCTDYKLFLEHYEVKNFEILSGCYFRSQSGFFDDYLWKWFQEKSTSYGGRRLIAKLFMNNLYGKMATSINSSFKYISGTDETGRLLYKVQEEYSKKTLSIAVGSAITSYAREFTIRAAQANYERFIYADTDSLHLTGDENSVTGVRIHDSDFNAWKCEKHWKTAIFVQQKRYIEIEDKDGQDDYEVKCAGMKRDCKRLFELSLKGWKNLTREEKDYVKGLDDREALDFVKVKRKLQDFRKGLKVPHNLKARIIKGGVILENKYFTML